MSSQKEKIYRSPRNKALADIYVAARSSGLTLTELLELVRGCYRGERLLLRTPFGKAVQTAMFLRVPKAEIILALSRKPREGRTQIVHKVTVGTMAAKGLPSTVTKLDRRTKMRPLKSRPTASFVQGGAVSPK